MGVRRWERETTEKEKLVIMNPSRCNDGSTLLKHVVHMKKREKNKICHQLTWWQAELTVLFKISSIPYGSHMNRRRRSGGCKPGQGMKHEKEKKFTPQYLAVLKNTSVGYVWEEFSNIKSKISIRIKNPRRFAHSKLVIQSNSTVNFNIDTDSQTFFWNLVLHRINARRFRLRGELKTVCQNFQCPIEFNNNNN